MASNITKIRTVAGSINENYTTFRHASSINRSIDQSIDFMTCLRMCNIYRVYRAFFCRLARREICNLAFCRFRTRSFPLHFLLRWKSIIQRVGERLTQHEFSANNGATNRRWYFGTFCRRRANNATNPLFCDLKF